MTSRQFAEFIIKSPYESVFDTMEAQFRVPVVERIDSAEDMRAALSTMARAASIYSFLCPVRSFVNNVKARSGKGSETREDLIRKVELLDAYINVAGMTRENTSRMFSCVANIHEQMKIEGSIM